MIKRKIAAAAAAVTIVLTMPQLCVFADDETSSYAAEGYAATEEYTAEEYTADESAAETETALTDISSARVEPVADMEYTGAEIKPALTVTLGGKTLAEGTDYTLAYADNVEEGTAQITVSGIGAYTGSFTVYFNIVVSPQAAVAKLECKNQTASSYTLTWTAAQGANGYELFRYNNSSKEWDKIATTSSLKYEVRSRSSATKEHYCIRAYRIAGSRRIYSEYTRLYTATLPAAVTGAKISSVTESGYKLSWKKVERAESYRVYMYNKSTKKYSLYKTSTTNSVKISGKQAGEKNTYKICAVINVNGKVLEGKQQKVQFTTKPAQVTGFTCESTKKGYITFKWNPVKNASKYQIYYAQKKDGSYTLLKEVGSGKRSLLTGLAPQGKKLYFKIRAVSTVGECTQNGKCSSKIRGISFNKIGINANLNTYSNSRSVKQINSQGYKLSDYNRNRLKNQLTYLGGDAGYIIYDIDSGSAVAYNANTYFGTASTVKMPYVLYCLRQMEDGDPSMNEMLTYKPSDYNGGSSWIKYQPFYTQYSIKTVIELIGDYSDNCGYYMMQDRFGYTGYNNFISRLGCRTTVSPSVRWGYVSACDSAREWNNMWDYLRNGRYAKFAREVFSTTCAANIRAQLGNRYTVYEKSGWTSSLYNETALVRAEHPYIVICLSNRTSAQRMRNIAEISESIHNEMWDYYD